MNNSSVPQVFLSLSGKDDAFVEKVWRHLPEGLAIFYRKSFANGQELLSAMEAGINAASIFVLFVSNDSIRSHWVKFEIDNARLAHIKRPNFRVLAFPITPDVDLKMLPDWMQQFWIPRAGWGPRDIARYIRHVLSAPPIAAPALSVPVIGRGQFLDIATRRLMIVVSETNASPNVIVMAGISGIGRRTCARYFVEQAFPALPNLSIGPEFQLPQFADLADLYRGLRENIEPDFSFIKFQRDLDLFRNMDLEHQVLEVVNSLGYFAKLGQAVFVITGSGLFEDRGDLKPWVQPLVQLLAKFPDAKLCLVSNRQLRDEEVMRWSNSIQLYVPPLRDDDIQALMTATSSAYGIKPVSAPTNLVRSIGGHPQIAKAAVRLIAQKGTHILEKDPSTLFSIQDEILSENLDVEALSDLQKEILCILSWVPQIEGRIVESLIIARRFTSEQFIKAMEDMILGCLVLTTESSFMISSAIREMFRRRYGFGPQGLLQEFSKILEREWMRSKEQGEFQGQLFDAFVFMHALEGKSLPPELRSLLLPSTLREVVKESYDRGRDDDDADALRRVVAWGKIATTMKMDEAVREEILSTVMRAHVRLSEYSQGDEILKIFDQKGYRSGSFLRGFSLRRREKYREAIPLLRQAVAMQKYDRSAVQELATCFQKLGMWKELNELVHQHKDIVERSAALLDFRIGTLIAAARITEAETAIKRLQSLPQDEGRSVIRQAQILIQRDNNFSGAEKLLSTLVEKKVGNAVAVRRWRAMAAALAGHFDQARQDIAFIRARPGRQMTADRLEVHFALAKGDYEAAEAALAKIGGSVQDSLLRARILEARAVDTATALSDRERLRMEASVLRAKNKFVTEFDFE